ncbi:MAG TPA: hypothetical protein VK995_05290, partial [Oceanipulchritudo sp.]|nr:hypothetical protein [Oceanipulchritudo sp.]
MDDQLLILLGLLAIAYFLFTPLILIIVSIGHRKRIRQLEAVVDEFSRHPESRVVAPAPTMAREVTPGVEAPRPEPPPSKPVRIEPIPVAPIPARPAAVATPRPEVRDAVMGPSWGDVVTNFLRGVGMWPPSTGSGQTRETVLMQWWLPRVGGMMALLSALFFGVYINQTTSPLFKCLELVAVSLGIAGLGRFMERKYATFGGVLMVTGLIMLYLTSVAAYVLPATQVIENPLLGAILQALVLAVICVVGLLRRSGGIVLLAFHFGYFMAVFMAWEGLREGALIAGALLFAAGAVMSRIKPFRNLSWVVVPGTFVIALAFPAIMAVWKVIELPANIPVQVYLNLVLAGIVAQYLVGLFANQLRARILLSLGTSLSILAVFCYYRIILPDTLQWAVLALGCTMLALSLVAWVVRGSGYLFQLLFIKATFLIGVWAILHFAGDLRWIVLALQTVVVAVSARRARQPAMELAVWAVAIV